jgi:hypothetical protein
MTKLPLYYIDINLEDNNLGMSCISMVYDPAVESDFICFSNEEMNFTANEEHCVTGVAIRANRPIYRNKDGYEFNVVFTPDVIKKIVEKYTRENLWNTVSLQHDGNNITTAICVEHYIKDSSKGISPKGFEDIEEGSLFTTFKILDEELWQEIKKGDTIRGFSIEIMSDLVEKMSKDENVEDIIEEYIKGFKQDHFASKTVDKVDPLIPAINDVVAPAGIDLNTFNPDSLRFAIENKLYVMLTYSGTSGTGSRQCAVMSWGDTIAGNECIRISQDFGSSESGEMGCKLLLTSDIVSFHVLTFMRPWTSGEIGYYGETSTGENGTMVNVRLEAVI